MRTLRVDSRFNGPPNMGHGGYVAALLTEGTSGAMQVTLRRPTPIAAQLELLALADGKLALMQGELLIAEAEPTALDFDVPPAVSLQDARAAEAGSPAHYGERGVHPLCFGCGKLRPDGLRVFVGPLEANGARIVAGTFDTRAFRTPDGALPREIAIASLDCPGAFAFLAEQTRAGLLGRIAFAQHASLPSDEELIVTGNRLGQDGRKLFAGTALYDTRGTLLASAKATWFQGA